MNTDSLTQVMDTVKNVANATGNANPPDAHSWTYWVGGALALGVIVFAAALKQRNPKREALKQKLKSGTVDFDGLMNSAFHSQELYDELKKKCHPDRFSTNPRLVEKATEIFALITKNKYNYQALAELKERAEKELHVKF